MRRLGFVALFALYVVAGGACGGCGKKSQSSNAPAPEITGLAAVPATAEAVIGFDVTKLANSPLADRAVDQLLLRDATLSANWAAIRDGCKIDFVKQVKRVVIAIGPSPSSARPGSGPLLAVATGGLPEHDLSECIQRLVGKGNGTVSGKDVDGRTLYQVKDGERAMYFSFGRADTVVLGNTESFVLEALGTGKKISDNPDMAAWLKLVDQNAPVWGAARFSEKISQGLVRVTKGELKVGPAAGVITFDPTAGAKLDLGAVMTSPNDAKVLETYLTDNKKLLVQAAQFVNLGKVVTKVDISTDANVVWLKAPFDMDDVNHVLSILDGKKASEHVSPPPSPGGDSGSQSPP